jgi:hypothetical protein
MPSRRGVTSSSQTPPLIEEEATLPNTYTSRREQISLSWILMGFKKPTITALARASSNLTYQPTKIS